MVSGRPAEPNAAHVEDTLEKFKNFLRQARQLAPVDCEAVISRLRVEMILEEQSRARKTTFRAVIDYFEDVLEERLEKLPESRSDTKSAIRRYIARFLDNA